MIALLAFVGLGALLIAMGWAGRRHSAALGAVPGMPAELEAHRIAVIHRGATTCLVIGFGFVFLGAASPFL